MSIIFAPVPVENPLFLLCYVNLYRLVGQPVLNGYHLSAGDSSTAVCIMSTKALPTGRTFWGLSLCQPRGPGCQPVRDGLSRSSGRWFAGHRFMSSWGARRPSSFCLCIMST